MTEKDKQLLLMDLCSRLYSDTIVNYNDMDGCDYPLNIKTMCSFPEEKLKCYLRPMDSMSPEEFNDLSDVATITLYPDGKSVTNGKETDWLIKHRFDYRNLIEKGLALPAPDGMYKIK